MTEPRPEVGAARHAERLDRARGATAAAGASALLIGAGPDLRYLTGHTTLPLERLTMLVLGPSGPASLIAPRLEAMAAAGCPAAGQLEIVAWDETDDPYVVVVDRLRAALGGDIPSGARLLVTDQLWAVHLLGLQRALPEARFGLASAVLRRLRMVKDADELALLRLAARAADRVVDAIAAGRLIGRTELEIAREVRERLVAEGHEEAAFAIVASGPNSASPHHEPTDRVIRAGEPIVLDIGGSLGGYASDITRTLWVTGGDAAAGPPPEFLRIFELVREAQSEATAAARPGVAPERVDAVARGIITTGGYGPAFMHRVGHGIGLEVHEHPYLVSGNTEPLEPGNAFSIEPGIYLAGRFGVRIEDIVACGPSGPIVLNEADRNLRVVSG